MLRALREAEGEASLDACLLPLEAGLVDFPAITLDERAARGLAHGQAMQVSAAPADTAVACDVNGRALGIVTVDTEGWLRPRRLFAWATAAGMA